MKKKTDKSEAVAVSLGDELLADVRMLIMDAFKKSSTSFQSEREYGRCQEIPQFFAGKISVGKIS
jgi:hypothetical protein